MSYYQSDDAQVTLHTRKFITNRFLQLWQMVVDVLHLLRPIVSKTKHSDIKIKHEDILIRVECSWYLPTRFEITM